jgi:cAMP phosphodiesterase
LRGVPHLQLASYELLGHHSPTFLSLAFSLLDSRVVRGVPLRLSKLSRMVAHLKSSAVLAKHVNASIGDTELKWMSGAANESLYISIGDQCALLL